MLPFWPHAFQMNVQLHPLSHRSLSFQDHVYELLNTIDACQCFFDIVSINVAILSHFKQLSPTPEAQVCLVYYCHNEVTLAELYCFSDLRLFFTILNELWECFNAHSCCARPLLWHLRLCRSNFYFLYMTS